jgi:beta-fructofuranosidase
MLLAYPTNKSDPKLIDWSYVSNNPVIYANSTKDTIPYGRDPTEFWKCGNDNNQYCVGYSTQLSEGCPCSNISGFTIFSSKYHQSSNNIGYWSEWINEGYLLNDTNNAVMWECPDFYNLFNDTWLFKYSIGPGPSSDNPWGVAARDYYVTGTYDPRDIMSFQSNIDIFAKDMSRSEDFVYDTGAFYASKSFNYQSNRILWGWNPEERPVNGYAEPYGWAGVMSLPRSVIPYKNIYTNNWYVKTPPVDFVNKGLRNISSKEFYSNINLKNNNLINLNNSRGQQIEILAFYNILSNNVINGSIFGFRVLSSINTSTINDINEIEEYTEIGIKYINNSNISGIYIYVNTLYSCSNYSSIVNRSSVSSSIIKLNELNLNEDIDIRIIIDHSIIETYFNNGHRVITRRVYPSNPNESINIQLFSNNIINIINITTWNLRSANITTTISSTTSSSDNNNNDNFTEEIWIWIIIGVLLLLLLLLLYYNRDKYYKSSNRESLLSNF